MAATESLSTGTDPIPVDIPDHGTISPSTLPGVQEFLHDTRGVHYIHSGSPDLCMKEDTMMGIDEAGRGPVLGPMVYGTSYYPISMKEEFEQKKFADSKVLDLKQRETLFTSINESQDWIGWKVAIISPDYISNCMLRRAKHSLNEVSHDAAIDLIRKVLADGVRLTEVYVDTVGDPRKYESKLSEIFPHLKITVSKKADSLFPVVSAASICAKVIRDVCVSNWKFVEERDIETEDEEKMSTEFGSGYPSDPATKKWLKDSIDPVFGFPSVVRFDWSTCKEKLHSLAHDVKWPDDEQDDMSAAWGNTKISQYFNNTHKPAQRHRYFEERGMKSVTTF